METTAADHPPTSQPCAAPEPSCACDQTAKPHASTGSTTAPEFPPCGPKKWEKVVDKTVYQGAEIMPLDPTVFGALSRGAGEPPRIARVDLPRPRNDEESTKDRQQQQQQQQQRGEPVRDAFVLEDVLSGPECDALVKAAEQGGFTFWDEAKTASSDFRAAFTIEVKHQELADLIWSRVARSISPTFHIDPEDKDRFECDLEGDWDACGINPHFLFCRYRDGAHFGPHSDGSTVLSLNHRSLSALVLYLNDVADGGGTAIVDNKQQEVAIAKDGEGRYRSKPEFVLDVVEPKKGRGLSFYYTQMHEGCPVVPGSEKYIIRTDILYKRREPIFCAPSDLLAFDCWNTAQTLAEKGDTDGALLLFKKCCRLSPGLAALYGM
eukprot:GHVT01043188.1.p1 GENE.GHVT01043188.1~~GHVT01043188.1.p1  ORF type:complete len:379 (+),score=83.32 GHVT01043188.1:809-1945(+)